jgi:hypothetical protein
LKEGLPWKKVYLECNVWEIVFCWKCLLSCLVHNDQKLLKECSTQRTDLSIGLFTFFLYFSTLNKWISLLSVSLPIDLYFNFLLFPSLLWNNLFYLSIYIYKYFTFLCLLYSLRMNEHIYAPISLCFSTFFSFTIYNEKYLSLSNRMSIVFLSFHSL